VTAGAASALVFVTGPDPDPDPALLGAKAASLMRLACLGFPVPPLRVVTTAAYRDVARTPQVRDALAAAPAADTDEERRRIDEAFLHAPLPYGLEAELRDAAAALAPEGRPLVVRSSATAEDLAGASFAGQYRSFIGVEGTEGLLDAVRLTWASLWHPAPRRYREALALAEDAIEMAVLLMPLVPATAAGVVFTVDPIGQPDHLRVELVHGLGESLVSGKETPEAWSLPRGSIDTLAPNRLVADVGALAIDVEASLGQPQDIEWAWDGEVLHVVQARPISVERRGGGADRLVRDDARRDHSYSTAGIAEMLPGVIPPLVWDTFGALVDEAMVALFSRLGAPPEPLRHGLLTQRSGRAVIDLTTLDQVAGSLPGVAAGLVSALEAGEHRTRRDRVGRLQQLRHDVRAARVRREALLEAEIFELAVPRVLDAHVDPRLLDDDEALAYRARLLDLMARGTHAEVAIAAAAVASFGSLESFLRRYLDDGVAQRAVTDLARRAFPAAARRWLDLAGLARSSPAGAGFLAAESWSEAMSHLEGGWRGAGELRAAMDQELRRAGSRSIPGGGVWEECPERAWQAIVASHRRARRGDELDPQALRDLLVATPRWQRLLMLTGFVADPQGILLGHHIEEAQRLLTRREALKAALLSLGGEVRRLHLDIGRRLVERDQLAIAADVDLLFADELAPTLQGHGPPRAELLRRRRTLDDWANEPARGSDVSDPDVSQDAGWSASSLVGWAASAGTHVGPVRVVHHPDESIDPGDVVVAVTTDSSWVRVFLDAGALIVEQGGPLSHAAIVARELGLPAVVNVPGAVDRFSHGPALVRVDGTTGQISVLEEGGR
jgi:rifampicin phosphotransferase